MEHQAMARRIGVYRRYRGVRRRILGADVVRRGSDVVYHRQMMTSALIKYHNYVCCAHLSRLYHNGTSVSCTSKTASALFPTGTLASAQASGAILKLLAFFAIG